MGKFIKENNREIHIFDHIDELTAFAYLIWQEMARCACTDHDYFAVALSGGKTPIHFFKALAQHVLNLPWDKTHIFLVDERFVPFDHKDSNYRLIKQHLLDYLALHESQIHVIPVSADTPQTAARRYEMELKDFFGLKPTFDLILLGLGEDGHTASLLPDVLTKDKQWVIPVDHKPHQRVTLTLPVINQAKNVVFLVTGAHKAQIVKSVIQERMEAYPASYVIPKDGKLFFLLDHQAAKELTIEQKRPRIPKLRLSGTSY